MNETVRALNRPLLSQQLVEALIPTAKVMETLGQQFVSVHTLRVPQPHPEVWVMVDRFYQ